MSTREDVILDLQDKVEKNYIVDIEQLEKAIKDSGYELEPLDDVLAPISYNICDRCGALEHSELDLYWFDYYDEDDEEHKTIVKGCGNNDYCAVCFKCVGELIEIGKEN